MKKSIVLLGHGSKATEGNNELIALAGMVKEVSGADTTGYCFLEYAEPDIPTGLVAAVDAGADEVYAVPMLLFKAGHMKKDYPAQVEIARKSRPDAQIMLCEHIGQHDKLIQIVKNRVDAVSKGNLSNAAVLLVGRGSLDERANDDANRIVDKLVASYRKSGMPDTKIEFCFLGMASPDIPNGIRNCIDRGVKRVYIVPYFLFNGVLINRIKKMVEKYQKDFKSAGVELRLGQYMGVDRLLAEVVSCIVSSN